MAKKESVLKLGIILFLICGTVTLALSVVNDITAPLIAQITEQQQNEARTEVLPKAETFEKISEEVYRGFQGDSFVGYAVTATPNGYGGTINMMVGLDEEFQVTGLKIVTFSETPGLGSKSSEPKFLDQFLGKNEEVTVVKGSAKGTNDVVAVSGATISSNAVANGVRDAVRLAKEAGGAK